VVHTDIYMTAISQLFIPEWQNICDFPFTSYERYDLCIKLATHTVHYQNLFLIV